MLKKTISTKFDAADMKHLNYLYALCNRPASYLLTPEAPRTYLDTQTKKLEFMEGVRTAANNLKQTGLHCDHSEASCWLQSLANGQIIELPKCHK